MTEVANRIISNCAVFIASQQGHVTSGGSEKLTFPNTKLVFDSSCNQDTSIIVGSLEKLDMPIDERTISCKHTGNVHTAQATG